MVHKIKKVPQGMPLGYYTKRFGWRFRALTDAEVEAYDENFMSHSQDWFGSIASSEGLNERQSKKFVDLMYKVLLVKGEIDERYDNVLIGQALRKARKK